MLSITLIYFSIKTNKFFRLLGIFLKIGVTFKIFKYNIHQILVYYDFYLSVFRKSTSAV